MSDVSQSSLKLLLFQTGVISVCIQGTNNTEDPAQCLAPVAPAALDICTSQNMHHVRQVVYC